MPAIPFDALQPGDALPGLDKPPISRHTLALFCGASNDHNPIHVDIDFARAAGLPDVFAHGMLSMAYLGQMLTNWVPQGAIRSFSVRFCAITHVGDLISCRGTIIEKFEHEGERRLRVELIASKQDGEVTLKGEAVIAV